MSVQQKMALICIYTLIVCGTILYVFLFIALWPERTYVGLSLLFVILLSVLVWLHGRFTEQVLRYKRYRYQEEIPLDSSGEPRHWPNWAQPNPYRRQSAAATPAPYAASYQEYEPQPYQEGYHQ
jgi:hypothetical protein